MVEAARVLRIGRTAAYELARRWRETGGEEGLPVVAFGRVLRVPRTALEDLSGGPVVLPRPPARKAPAAAGGPAVEPVLVARATPPHSSARRHRRVRAVSPDQSSLPLE